jgi:TRAP-type mannitol/chloroaromatic compound transport system permease small subunit
MQLPVCFFCGGCVSPNADPDRREPVTLWHGRYIRKSDVAAGNPPVSVRIPVYEYSRGSVAALDNGLLHRHFHSFAGVNLTREPEPEHIILHESHSHTAPGRRQMSLRESLLRFSGLIDRMTSAIGRASSWLVLAMVLLGALNAIARYSGRFLGMSLSSNAFLEAQWYMFSLVFLLGAAYALREDAHVRVDVLLARLRPRARSRINIGGTLLLLLPFCIFSLWVSLPAVINSWKLREGSPDPGGLPRYPLKTFIIVCFVLLILQGISELIKELYKPEETEVAHDQHSQVGS